MIKDTAPNPVFQKTHIHEPPPESSPLLKFQPIKINDLFFILLRTADNKFVFQKKSFFFLDDLFVLDVIVYDSVIGINQHLNMHVS
jgi:hypothetical protein